MDKRARRYGYSFATRVPAEEVLLDYILAEAPDLTLKQAARAVVIADDLLCEDDIPLSRAVKAAVEVARSPYRTYRIDVDVECGQPHVVVEDGDGTVVAIV